MVMNMQQRECPAVDRTLIKEDKAGSNSSSGNFYRDSTFDAKHINKKTAFCQDFTLSVEYSQHEYCELFIFNCKRTFFTGPS